MVTIPVEGRWSLKPLDDRDVADALVFLRRDPLVNVYLISRLIEEKSAAATQIFAVRYNGAFVLLASLSTNVVLAADREFQRDLVESAMALLADRIVMRMVPVRAIISPAPLVEMLWDRLRSRLDPPTVVRMNQPIYAMRKRLDLPDLHHARYSTLAELDRLVPACAAMHKEEVGIDPLDRDPAGYRERIRELVEKKRSIILLDGKEITAKCEFSAVTPDGVQLMGVWTAPAHRRKGLAARLLREVCGHLSRQGRNITLFVNDFNLPAISLYEGLGFQRIGMNRALIW